MPIVGTGFWTARRRLMSSAGKRVSLRGVKGGLRSATASLDMLGAPVKRGRRNPGEPTAHALFRLCDRRASAAREPALGADVARPGTATVLRRRDHRRRRARARDRLLP